MDELAAKQVLLDFELITLIALVVGVAFYALLRRMQRREPSLEPVDYDMFDLVLMFFPAVLFLMNPVVDAVMASSGEVKPIEPPKNDIFTVFVNIGYFSFVGIMTCGIIEWIRNRRVVDLFGLRELSLPKIVVISILGGVASLLICAWAVGGLSNSYLEGVFGELEVQEPVKMFQESNSLAHLSLSILMACIAAPVVEEFSLPRLHVWHSSPSHQSCLCRRNYWRPFCGRAWKSPRPSSSLGFFHSPLPRLRDFPLPLGSRRDARLFQCRQYRLDADAGIGRLRITMPDELLTQRLGDIGEETVVDHLIGLLPPDSTLVVGPGDDCAVVPLECGLWQLLKTDCLVEGIHFLPGTAPELVGRKAINRVISDIAAMGGHPHDALVTLAVDPDRSLGELDGWYRGMVGACEAVGCRIVGGETSRLAGEGSGHFRGHDGARFPRALHFAKRRG